MEIDAKELIANIKLYEDWDLRLIHCRSMKLRRLLKC